MYNKELARQVLSFLADEFPRRLAISEVKEKLPQFSDLPNGEWALAIHALHKSGHVDAQFILDDQSYDPLDVASVEITAGGRRQITPSGHLPSSKARRGLADLPGKSDFLTQARPLIQGSKPASVLFIDLDEFKQVNDTCGHAAGDKCLELVVRIMWDVIEGKGSIFRYGGDEFVVLLPNFDNAEAVATAERIRAAIEDGNVGGMIRVTASIGISSAQRPKDTTVTNLVDAADKAMYEAKDRGRNLVVIHAARPSPVERGLGGSPAPPRSGDLAKRVEGVEISASLEHRFGQNYLVNVKNESDEEVSVTKLCLQRNGIRLTDPGRPLPNDNWTVPPKSTRPIDWHTSPDPVFALQAMYSEVGIFFQAEIEILLSCDILGKLREFKQKILVHVNVVGRGLKQLAG